MRKNFPTRHWQDDAFSLITNTINRFCFPTPRPCPLYSLDYLLTRIFHIPISWPLPVLFPHLKWAYHPLPHPDLVHSKGVLPAEHASMEQQYGGYCGFHLRPSLPGPCIYILESGMSATDSSQLHPSQSQGTALPMVMSPPRAALQQWFTDTEFSKVSPETSVQLQGGGFSLC